MKIPAKSSPKGPTSFDPISSTWYSDLSGPPPTKRTVAIYIYILIYIYIFILLSYWGIFAHDLSTNDCMYMHMHPRLLKEVVDEKNSVRSQPLGLKIVLI